MSRPGWRSVPCRDFAGKVNRDGYGLQRKHDTQGAHRVAWIEAYGPIPRGLHVLHYCDRPVCTEPLHLYLGTNEDNVADRQSKERQARGERYGTAKLSNDQVAEISRRLATESGTALAQEFGVSKAAVSNIRSGRSWAWMTRPERKELHGRIDALQRRALRLKQSLEARPC